MRYEELELSPHINGLPVGKDSDLLEFLMDRSVKGRGKTEISHAVHWHLYCTMNDEDVNEDVRKYFKYAHNYLLETLR